MKKSAAGWKRWLVLAWAVLLPALWLPAAVSAEDDLALRQFEACAFGTEYNGDYARLIRKWTGGVRVFFAENYTNEDVAFFHSFLQLLAEKVPDFPAVSIVNRKQDANVVLHYVRLDSMGKAVEAYVEGNWGFFTYWWNDQNEIYKAEIAIAYDVTTQENRNKLVLEEFIGGSGLGQDHQLDSSSILYHEMTGVQTLTDADWRMLRMLYSPRVKPGMDSSQAMPIAQTIQ